MIIEKILFQGPPNVFRNCRGTSQHSCLKFAAMHGFVTQGHVLPHFFQLTELLDMLSRHRKGKQRIEVGCKVVGRSTQMQLFLCNQHEGIYDHTHSSFESENRMSDLHKSSSLHSTWRYIPVSGLRVGLERCHP